MIRRSLHGRLLIGAAAGAIALVTIAALGLGTLFEIHVKRWIDVELRSHLDQVTAGIDQKADGSLTVARQPTHPLFQQPFSGLYWNVFIEPDGPTLRSRSLWDFELVLPTSDKVDDVVHHHRVAGPSGQTLYLLQRHIKLPERLGGKTALAADALDETKIGEAVRDFSGALLPFLVVFAVVLILLAWLQIVVGLRPLGEVQKRIAAIKAGQARRLGHAFPSEVQPLAREIDSLLDNRDKQLENARLRASDLAHGLRTPLQIMLGQIKALGSRRDAEALNDLATTAQNMHRQVDRHLTRARLNYADRNARARIATVVNEVVQVMRRTPRGKNIDWRAEIPADLFARIDPDDLSELAGNLIENSVRYARSKIRVAVVPDDKEIKVQVWDDGPGISGDDADTVLERGVRLDTKTPGSGLGLAIVSDIVDAWQGDIEFLRVDGQFGVSVTLGNAS